MFYICTRKTELGYGVMVTLQILVLSFQVRILVAQLKQNKARRCRSDIFLFLGYRAFCISRSQLSTLNSQLSTQNSQLKT